MPRGLIDGDRDGHHHWPERCAGGGECQPRGAQSKAPRSRSRRRTPMSMSATPTASRSTPTGTKGKVIDNGNGTFSYDPNGAFEPGARDDGDRHVQLHGDRRFERLVDGDGDDHHHRGTNEAPVANDIAADCAGARPGGDGHGVLYRSRYRRHPQLLDRHAPAPRARSSTTATAPSATIRTAPSPA